MLDTEVSSCITNALMKQECSGSTQPAVNFIALHRLNEVVSDANENTFPLIYFISHKKCSRLSFNFVCLQQHVCATNNNAKKTYH